MKHNKSRVLIVGAGIGGLTTALALEKQGYEVSLFESAPAITEAGSGLSVMTNAMNALQTIGAAEAVASAGQNIERFVVKHRSGRIITEMPLREMSDELGAPSICISRSALQQALMSRLRTPVTLGAACTSFRQSDAAVIAEFSDGRTVQGDLLVGADGFNSVVRRQLFGPQEPRPVNYMVWLALVPFQHPVFTKGYVGHYWDRGMRFGLIDIGNGMAYWWATANVPAHEVEQASRSGVTFPRDAKQKLLARYGRWAPEVVAAIEQTERPILELVTLDREPLPTWSQGRVTLLGDAAHPMLTSLGQGACMAIEDGIVLGECIGRHASDIGAALRDYEARRRKRAHMVVELSRKISTLEQLENPIAVALRNTFFKLAPQSVLAQQNRPVLTYREAV